jgi:hypothetical protein
VRVAPGLAALLTACQWPRDADETLGWVTGGTLPVALVEAEPWVVLDEDEPDGVEVRLVEELAGRLDTEVEWVQGSESALMAALTCGRSTWSWAGSIRRPPGRTGRTRSGCGPTTSSRSRCTTSPTSTDGSLSTTGGSTTWDCAG